jgi:hypothetical protein
VIKRQWGYDHVLLKGLGKVEAELGLIFTVYNLRRLITIVGAKELIAKLLLVFSKIRPVLKRYKQLKISGKSLTSQKTSLSHLLILTTFGLNPNQC